MKSTISTLLLSASALFATTASALSFTSETFTATLEDRDATQPTYDMLAPVGVHSQLSWAGFGLSAPDTSSTSFSGVEVHSGKNYASAPVLRDFFPPSLTTSYEGSEIVFFDLESFWWGCSVKDMNVHIAPRQLPGWCTLEVLGYTPGSLLPTAHAISFYFPRDNPSTMGMVEARLPGSFKAVSRVEFKIDGVEQPVMLYLDDVRYTVYNVTNMEGGIGNVVHQEVVSRKEGAQKALKREVPFKA